MACTGGAPSRLDVGAVSQQQTESAERRERERGGGETGAVATTSRLKSEAPMDGHWASSVMLSVSLTRDDELAVTVSWQSQ